MTSSATASTTKTSHFFSTCTCTLNLTETALLWPLMQIPSDRHINTARFDKSWERARHFFFFFFSPGSLPTAVVHFHLGNQAALKTITFPHWYIFRFPHQEQTFNQLRQHTVMFSEQLFIRTPAKLRNFCWAPLRITRYVPHRERKLLERRKHQRM